MNDRLIEMTTEIVANYVTGNKIAQADLAALIQSVFTSLANIDAPEEPSVPTVDKPTTAQIKKSIKPDGLVSFEDGKTYKTLKRHLTTRGMSVADYKEKWGLPADYPTTAPGYSAMRSEMAKSLGLGQKRKAVAKTAKPKAKPVK